MTFCLLMASALPSFNREVIGSNGFTSGPVQPSLRRFKVWITREASSQTLSISFLSFSVDLAWRDFGVDLNDAAESWSLQVALWQEYELRVVELEKRLILSPYEEQASCVWGSEIEKLQLQRSTTVVVAMLCPWQCSRGSNSGSWPEGVTVLLSGRAES